MHPDIYDCTLREGSQSVGISLSVADKLRLTALLDSLGVSYIEGGIPGSTPKEDEFYRQVQDVPLHSSRIVAFGSTCRAHTLPQNDALLCALGDVPVQDVCIFGKTNPDMAVHVLGIAPEENLELIHTSVAYLRARSKRVFFDCEHFFFRDGSDAGSDLAYGCRCVCAAADAGASAVILCDTNGRADPGRVQAAVLQVRTALDESGFTDVRIGVHMHNDCGMADANTYVAAGSGAEILQTTLFGVGERCGNADFFTTVPNVRLRLGKPCLLCDSLSELTPSAYKAAEILNVTPRAGAPYIGRNAFSHKAGTHINAVVKTPASFENVEPETVGNTRRFITSEVSGRTGIRARVEAILGSEIDNARTEQILERLKQMEFEGYQFESAEASFALLVRKMYGLYRPLFRLNSYKVITFDEKADSPYSASAIVDLEVGGREEVTAGNGIGPVDALDCAFRRAMSHFYPQTADLRLVDYKVRVLDSAQGTASKVRVFIEWQSGTRRWCTVGVSGDIIQASWYALVDAYEYRIHVCQEETL